MLQHGEVLQGLHSARAGNSVTEGSCSAPDSSSASAVDASRLCIDPAASPSNLSMPMSPQDSHLVPKSSVCLEAAVPGESILICTQIVYFKSVFLIRSFFLLYYYVSSRETDLSGELARARKHHYLGFIGPTYVENICGGVIMLT